MTSKNYFSNLQQFILFSGKKDAAQVKVEDVLAWHESMEKRELAPHTISIKLATLRALLEYFRDYGVIYRNPATTWLVPPPKSCFKARKVKCCPVKEVGFALYDQSRQSD